MKEERIILILKRTLETIAFEAKEPIIKVYAQSALDETRETVKISEPDIKCTEHRWYGRPNERCPLCQQK